jgi:CBS-domain-containing membrane protein
MSDVRKTELRDHTGAIAVAWEGAGGATALIAVIGSNKIHSLGYLYAIIPAGLGAVIMLVVALLVNNIPKSRRYPDFWV